MKKQFNTFYVKNIFCTGQKRKVSSVSMTDYLKWRAFIDFINTKSDSVSDKKAGTDIDAYYGLLNGVLSGTSYRPEHEDLVYTLDVVFSKLKLTHDDPELYGATYRGNVHKIDELSTITSDHSCYQGSLALNGDIVEVAGRFGGGTALFSECNEFENDWFVTDSADDYDLRWSEYNNRWICTDDCYVHHGVIDRNGNTGWFENDDYVYAQDTGRYFASEDLAVRMGCYYDDNDEEWYEEQETVHRANAGYHNLGRMFKCNLGDAQFRVGFEVEKEDGEAGLIHYDQLYNDTWWAKESDGSLDSSIGYELVSPTYDLFSSNLDDDIKNSSSLTTLIDASYSDRCGGHINVSSRDFEPEQLFEGLSGFFPLLYCIYQDRLEASYCPAKKKHEYYRKDKYSAIYMKGHLVEFRIFPAVKSVKNLLWRRDLMRIMCDNINKDEVSVLKMMATPSSPLYKHLRKVFTQDTIIRKIGLFVEFADVYSNKKIDQPKNLDNLKKTKDRLPDVDGISEGLGA